MAINTTTRTASAAEIAAEMDRRGVVIERLEAEVEALRAALRTVKARTYSSDRGCALKADAVAEIHDSVCTALSAHSAPETAPARDGWRPVDEAPKEWEGKTVWMSIDGDPATTAYLPHDFSRAPRHCAGVFVMPYVVPAAPTHGGNDGR